MPEAKVETEEKTFHPMKRVLDFDTNAEVQVKLGGREFVIKEQRFAVIARILRISQVGDKDWPDDTKQEQIMEANWEECLPAFAMILGAEDDTSEAHAALIAHLHQHLRIRPAIQIYNTWWEVNEVDDFLVRNGMMLVAPAVAASIKEHRDKFLESRLNPTDQDVEDRINLIKDQLEEREPQPTQ